MAWVDGRASCSLRPLIFASSSCNYPLSRRLGITVQFVVDRLGIFGVAIDFMFTIFHGCLEEAIFIGFSGLFLKGGRDKEKLVRETK